LDAEEEELVIIALLFLEEVLIFSSLENPGSDRVNFISRLFTDIVELEGGTGGPKLT
jgi:hypothetical protein